MPCDSEAWPVAADIALFEVRRAIGQLVRTTTGIVKKEDDGRVVAKTGQVVDPVLIYLACARSLDDVLKQVTGELIAEARTRGIIWEEIGRSLGIGKKGAQKRSSENPIKSARIAELKRESVIAEYAAGMAAGEYEEVDIILARHGDMTGQERISLSVNLIVDLVSWYEEVDSDLESDRYDPKSVVLKLTRIAGSVQKLAEILILDPAVWMSIADQARAPETPDEANYYSPVMYGHLVMREVLFALEYTLDAISEKERLPNGEIDMERLGGLFKRSKQSLFQAAALLSRVDVSETLNNID